LGTIVGSIDSSLQLNFRLTSLQDKSEIDAAEFLLPKIGESFKDHFAPFAELSIFSLVRFIFILVSMALTGFSRGRQVHPATLCGLRRRCHTLFCFDAIQ
jgi:hypothetical protein